MQVYSNGFNIKLLGIPELKENEDVFETSALCVRLFNQMGGNVTINDIDLAHRITPRKATKSGPKPIVCKFTRRLARNSVMAARKDVSKVDPVLIGLTEEDAGCRSYTLRQKASKQDTNLISVGPETAPSFCEGMPKLD